MKMNEILTLVRENSDLTQQQVADILDVARTTYTEYENGETIPTIEKLCKLALYFNVNLDYILGLSKTKVPYGKMISFNYDRFTKNLVKYRKKAELTQKDLSKKISCSHTTISMHENQKAKMSYDTLIKLSKIYKTPTDYIVGIVKPN